MEGLKVATDRVLILDADDQRAADLAARARSDRWTTVIAPSASSALSALADPTPLALVLVDASMWSDAEVRSALVDAHPELPVIVLTDQSAAPDAVIAQLQLGAMSYVPRDAASRRVVHTVETIIGLTARNPYRERIREFLRSGALELQIGNDPALIPLVVGYIQRLLEDYCMAPPREQGRIGVAISEALSNAIIHGNLEVSSELREAMSDAYFDEIRARREVEPYVSRKVQVMVSFTQSSLTVVIRDQGKGFDRKAVADASAEPNIMALSGRGVLLMRAYTDALSWNDVGNEVTLTKVLKS